MHCRKNCFSRVSDLPLAKKASDKHRSPVSLCQIQFLHASLSVSISSLLMCFQKTKIDNFVQLSTLNEPPTALPIAVVPRRRNVGEKCGGEMWYKVKGKSDCDGLTE